MTRQALAELSALLAQRAVMASPSQVAKDALKLARYAHAADVNTADYLERGGLRPYESKEARIKESARALVRPYSLSVRIEGPNRFAFILFALPNTPPIQGYPEGYAI